MSSKNYLYEKLFAIKSSNNPYENNWEFIDDLCKLVDMKIYYYYKFFYDLDITSDNKNRFKGLVINRDEFESLLNDFSNLPIDMSHAEKDVQLAQSFIASRKEACTKKGIFLSLTYLSHNFDLTIFEEFCILLSAIPNINRKYEKIFGFLQDDISMKYPTLDLATKLFFLGDYHSNTVAAWLIAENTILKYIFEEVPSNNYSKLTQPLKLKKRILKFLFDPISLFSVDSDLMELFVAKEKVNTLYSNMDKYKQLVNLYSNDIKSESNNLIVNIYGKKGSGKKLALKKLAYEYDEKLVLINFDLLKEDKDINSIVLEIILNNALLCIYNYEENELGKKLVTTMLKYTDILFIVSVEKKLVKKYSDNNVVYIEFEVPNDINRGKIWRELSKDFRLSEDINLDEIANKFTFSTGQIINSLKDANNQRKLYGNDKITKKMIYKGCFSQGTSNLDKNASRINPIYKWNDLIIPEEQKTILESACGHIKYKHIVYEKWGFNKKLSYGRGLSMLFAGPPGTGKTMAAQVIANELSLELYKIDLSQIVSKYIGETEKNLAIIFDEAKESNSILFLDETDALLGKRSEVKDSHDKYANLETSFLLQKMEEYEGITIMTTNYLENIDEAFIRRITYITHFPFPDKYLREKIWKNIFPEETPIDTNIDYEYLAHKFELSGGSIKNIAVTSAFEAVQNNEIISMKYLLRGIKRELAKQGKILLKEDFGEYYFYLK